MKYNLADQLLYIDTNVKDIYYFPFAASLSSIFEKKSSIGVGFYVSGDIEKPNELDRKLDFFWGANNSRRLYYEHSLLPGVKAKMLLDITNDIPSIAVNKWYYRLAKYRFENVWPPGQHFTNLVVLKLLENNYLTLHCGSFFNKETKEGYLLFGASNTGKSYTTFKAIEEGYGYHSEDLTIVGKKYIYTTPLISTQSSMLPNKNWALKYNLFVDKLTGLNVFIPRIRNLDTFHKFFENQNIKAKSSPDKIFILEKGSQGIIKLTNKETVRKINILNKLELNYYRDHLFRTYSYFNKELDIEKSVDKERLMIKKIVNKSEAYLIKALSPDMYMKQIEKIIKD